MKFRSKLNHGFTNRGCLHCAILKAYNTAQKMKLSIKDLFNKCDQIRRKLRIWSHLLKKSLMENFNFCAVIQPLRPCHLTILPPFSPCHLTTFIHFSHLTSSLLSYLSQLTTLPTTNRPLQNSNILPLGRQGKHV